MNLTRKTQLMPDGKPKWIRCYDSGQPGDRYTVVFTKKAQANTRTDRWFLYVGMSGQPYHPQGFCQHGESKWQPADRPTYSHLGKRIDFFDLPQDCRKVVISDYCELWELNEVVK